MNKKHLTLDDRATIKAVLSAIGSAPSMKRKAAKNSVNRPMFVMVVRKRINAPF